MSSLDSSSKSFERLFSEFDSLRVEETSDKSSGLMAIDITDNSAEKIALAANKGMDLTVSIGNKTYRVKHADAESFLRRNISSIKEQPFTKNIDPTIVKNALQDIATLLEVKTVFKKFTSNPETQYPMSRDSVDKMLYLLVPTIDKANIKKFMDLLGTPKDGMLLVKGNLLINFLKEHEKALRIHPQLKDGEDKLGELLWKIKLPFKEIASTSISKKGWAHEGEKKINPSIKKDSVKSKDTKTDAKKSELGS